MSEKTWEWVDGYSNGTYTDDMVFEIDCATKRLQKIVNQTLVSGEDRSQFIRFVMDRYFDGIDLSTKNIQIIFLTEAGYSDINAAVCVERCEDQVRFGWLVPAAACAYAGVLSFSIEFVGTDYVLKTRTCEVEVYDGLNGGEVIPEPDEKAWYIELQERCDNALNKAEEAAGSLDAVIAVKDAVENEFEILGGTPLAASTAAGMTDTTKVYIYTGSETGYTFGHWYYYDGSAWQDGGAYNAVAVQTDSTLSISGAPADAKAVRDALSEASGLSEDAKTALLNCFAHVAWTDEHGPTYYGALESALYADSYPKITARFNPGLNVIYTDDTLDSLKQYLTVKYYATRESTGTVVASTDYSLLGTLVEGASTVFVSYSELTTSFIIDGVVDFYNIWERSLSDDNLTKIGLYTLDFNNSVTSRISMTEYNNRRAYGTTRGRVPYYEKNSNEPTSFFPIPIPANANKVSASITPSSQFLYLNFAEYDESDGKYYKYTDSGWSQGTNTKEFTAHDNLFLFFNSKYDSAGTSYPTEPSNVTVIFEEV